MMSKAHFLFFDRLRDFLQPHQKEGVVIHFRERQTIKHLAESLGVPHPEIGTVHINSVEGTLNAITQDGDRVDIYPVTDGSLTEPRFLLDGHLGRLTAHLRMLGFDCYYQNDLDDPQLAEISQREERILLTRDRRLLMRKTVTRGYCLHSLEPLEQLNEVIRRFALTKYAAPFHRCLKCNHVLEPVSKDEVLDRLEPLTKKYFDEFHICPNCKQIYWKGSHYEQMKKLVERIS